MSLVGEERKRVIISDLEEMGQVRVAQLAKNLMFLPKRSGDI